MSEYVLNHFNYWAFVVLMMIGLYVVFSTGNMVKKLVGLGVFQTSVFLFYISMGKVAGGQPPILPEEHHDSGELEAAVAHAPAGALRGGAAAEDGAHGAGAEIGDSAADVVPLLAAPSGPAATDGAAPAEHFSQQALDAVYSNPLPHVLILTAIVVGVATLAVGLALVVRIREEYGTIEDEDVNAAEYDSEVQGADA